MGFAGRELKDLHAKLLRFAGEGPRQFGHGMPDWFVEIDEERDGAASWQMQWLMDNGYVLPYASGTKPPLAAHHGTDGITVDGTRYLWKLEHPRLAWMKSNWYTSVSLAVAFAALLISLLALLGCTSQTQPVFPASTLTQGPIPAIQTASAPQQQPSLPATATAEPIVESIHCDAISQVSTLWSKSAANWVDRYMGQCSDFGGRLVASEGNLHIVGSWDAPYGLDIAVQGRKSCLNTEEHVDGLGTPVSFVGKVMGTLDVDDLQSGASLSLPLVGCWEGNRIDIVELCASWMDAYEVQPDGTEKFIPYEQRHECQGVTWEVPAPPFGTPLPPTITPIRPPRRG